MEKYKMADILVPEWDTLTEDEKAEISDGLKASGLLKDNDTLANDPSKSLPTGPIAEGWDPIGDICRAGCDAVAATAFAWCVANTAGTGYLVCVAAAESARKECRRRC